MSYLDLEIERIKKYCAGLGVRLVFNTTSAPSYVATWSVDPYEIIIYTRKHSTKTNTILSILHELAHHFYYVHNNKPPIPDAYNMANDLPAGKTLAKRYRKHIYDYERNGIQYMAIIAKELELKIPLWKVEMQAEFDIWVYQVYYDKGTFPPTKELKLKKSELRELHRPKGTV